VVGLDEIGKGGGDGACCVCSGPADTRRSVMDLVVGTFYLKN
jgi:hypothetical protein